MARRNGTGTIRPCLDCGRPIRPKHWPAAKHPGTLAHAGNGKCSGCNTKKIRATQTVEVPSVPERPDTDYNRRALLDYFASRRKFRIALGQTEFPNPLNLKTEPEPEEIKPMVLRQNPCGTDAAYRRHIRNKETIDPACREAHRIACWEYQQRKRKEKNK